MVWYSHLFKNSLQFIVAPRVKGFSAVNETELDVFLELTYFLHDPTNVGNLISGSSALLNQLVNLEVLSSRTAEVKLEGC